MWFFIVTEICSPQGAMWTDYRAAGAEQQVAFVLRPSRVCEKVGVNPKGLNQK
jgi:hypothetical protein